MTVSSGGQPASRSSFSFDNLSGRPCYLQVHPNAGGHPRHIANYLCPLSKCWMHRIARQVHLRYRVTEGFVSGPRLRASKSVLRPAGAWKETRFKTRLFQLSRACDFAYAILDKQIFLLSLSTPPNLAWVSQSKNKKFPLDMVILTRVKDLIADEERKANRQKCNNAGAPNGSPQSLGTSTSSSRKRTLAYYWHFIHNSLILSLISNPSLRFTCCNTFCHYQWVYPGSLSYHTTTSFLVPLKSIKSLFQFV